MMKHKTAELEGAMLDAAVAKAKGSQFRLRNGRACEELQDHGGMPGGPMWEWALYRPSQLWSDGGYLVERFALYAKRWREPIPFTVCPDDAFAACVGRLPSGDDVDGFGPSYLIAAMRAFVKAKLGDEVDLPDSPTPRP